MVAIFFNKIQHNNITVLSLLNQVKTEASSAGEQLAMDSLDGRQKCQNKGVHLELLFLYF
jgi:hypothetical protein